MKLYVRQQIEKATEIADGRTLTPSHREASPAELLEAARPHANYQAAKRRMEALTREPWTDMGALKSVILAALGADDEEDGNV